MRSFHRRATPTPASASTHQRRRTDLKTRAIENEDCSETTSVFAEGQSVSGTYRLSQDVTLASHDTPVSMPQTHDARTSPFEGWYRLYGVQPPMHGSRKCLSVTLVSLGDNRQLFPEFAPPSAGFDARMLTPWVPNSFALDACGASENVSYVRSENRTSTNPTPSSDDCSTPAGRAPAIQPVHKSMSARASSPTSRFTTISER